MIVTWPKELVIFSVGGLRVSNVTDQTIALPASGLPSASVSVAVRVCIESPAVKLEGVMERTVPFFVGLSEVRVANNPKKTTVKKITKRNKITLFLSFIFSLMCLRYNRLFKKVSLNKFN